MLRPIPGLRVLALALSLCGGLAAQEPSKTRVLKTEGVKFTLPDGWSFVAAAAVNVAVTTPVEVGDRKDEITAELFFHPREFLGPRIDALEKQAGAKDSDRSAFQVKGRQSLAGERNVTLVSYKIQRGEGEYAREYQVNHWLFRRYGHLYEWKETTPRECAGQAAGLFSRARRALDLGKPEHAVESDPERRYTEQRVSFRLPQDWDWEKGRSGARVKLETPKDKFVQLFSCRTDALTKKGRATLFVSLRVVDSRQDLEKLGEGTLKHAREEFRDTRDQEMRDGYRFRGQKAVMAQFTGIYKKDQQPVRRFIRTVYFLHKGMTFEWQESVIGDQPSELQGEVEVARKGLRFQ